MLSSLRQSVGLGRAFVCLKGSCHPLMRAGVDSWASCKVPACPCLAVELSVSLQTKTTGCYILYYCLVNNPSNLAAGIIFSHMLHFFKYSLVLPSFSHRSQAVDTQLPLKSILISLNIFMTSGLKGPSWHHIPASRASTSLPSPTAQDSH